MALVVVFCTQVSAQFNIHVKSSQDFSPKEAYLYTLDGSKDILYKREAKGTNGWEIKVAKPYVGMMKLYFPENNNSVNFISENKDVNIVIESSQNKVTDVKYLDEANALMTALQDQQDKKEFILPALYQIKEYYKKNSDFGLALEKEINRLDVALPSSNAHPFINYYNSNYNKFLVKDATKTVSSADISNFLANTGDMLETSSLLRPILVAYINSVPSSNVAGLVNDLLTKLNVETPRGQTVLSELIDLFDLYGLEDLKQKYLAEAGSLKCTINDRLASTIETNKNTAIGAKFVDYKFHNATNTTAKSIYGVKSNKKVIIFWSSTCSHCEKELPDILQKYEVLKKNNIAVIGLSMDSDANSYQEKVKSLPWTNDSELKGWYSSYSTTYNVHGTPSYFVLDADNKIIAKPDHAKDVISFLKL